MVPLLRLACFLAFIYSASMVMAWSATDVLYSFMKPRAEDDLQVCLPPSTIFLDLGDMYTDY